MIQICTSLVEETTAAVIARMRDLAGLTDLFEVRGDLVRDLDLLTILRAKTDPLLFSARSVSEGGRWPDNDPRRQIVLLEAIKRGYEYVDVEYRSQFTDVMSEKAGRGLVVSYHDVAGVPENLDMLYASMCECGADVVKIAVTPRSIADVGRLMEFTAQTSVACGTPLVALAMGPLGVITRVVGGRYGAPFTFASASAGAEAAPGQIPVGLMADLYRVRSIGPETRVYGVLGRSVQRSLSPVLHNRAFEAAGIDAVFVPLQAEALEPFVEALPQLGLSGFAVTAPYKVDILPHLQEVDEHAALCGSVNTVVVHDGMLQGSTTDGLGVLTPLRKRIDVRGRRVVILGAGGAARSAVLSLLHRGAEVTLLARDPASAEFVAAAVGCGFGDLADVASFSWDVLINATPVGWAAGPDAGRSPIPASAHRPGTVVFDMVYDPLVTPFLSEAQAAGCTTIDGLEMLIAQAAAQFEAWTGQAAPLEEMKSAALSLAQRQGEQPLP
jgi:3-dehydroquinate dehydratase / shikimate dehydrogenase